MKKMRGGGEEIPIGKYFPVDIGDLFSMIGNYDEYLSSHKIIVDYNYQNRHIILPDSYYYVIINQRNDIKELIIFKNNNNKLYKIITIRQKSRKEYGTTINDNYITKNDDTKYIKYYSGLPENYETSIILKLKNGQYDTLKNKAYYGNGMFTSKTESYLPKEDIEGYYNINEEQEITNNNSNIKL